MSQAYWVCQIQRKMQITVGWKERAKVCKEMCLENYATTGSFMQLVLYGEYTQRQLHTYLPNTMMASILLYDICSEIIK